MNLGQYGHRPGLVRPPSFTPGGYLTAVSGQPVITADAVNVTTLFYTPDQHNALPVMRAGVFDAQAFDEAALPLTWLAANGIYDLLAYSDGAALRFGWSPSWQVATTGAGARGTGLGTPELMRRDGLFVNKNPILVSMGGMSRNISPGAGTYLASVAIGATAGQVTCHRSVGQSRAWSISNAFNRRRIILQVSDPTGSWSMGNASWRASNNDAGNSMQTFTGLADEPLSFVATQTVSAVSNSTQVAAPRIGIGFNSTSSPSGKNGGFNMSAGVVDGVTVSWGLDLNAACTISPSLGRNTSTFLEYNSGANVSASFKGAGQMLMTGEFKG